MVYVQPKKGDPAPGTRVHIFSADKSEDLGFGTYCGRVDVVAAIVDAGPEWMGATTPELELSNGEKIYGMQCWWTEAPDVHTNN